MAVNMVNSFKYHIKIMNAIGLWVAKDYPLIYKIYSFLIYILVVIPTPTLPIIYLMVSNDNNDLFQAAQDLFMAIQILSVIFKNYSILSNIEGVEKTFHLLNSHMLNQHYEDQDFYLKESTKIANRNTMIFLTFCVLSLSGWATLPLVTRSGKLPIDMWFPIDHEETTLTHCLKYIYLVSGVSYGATSHCVLDTLAAGLIALAGGQLKILKDTLHKLTKYTEIELKKLGNLSKQDMKKKKREIMYKKIGDCLNHHKAIIEFVNNIQTTYSAVMFWQLVVASIVICMSMVLLTFIEPNSFHFYFQSCFILTMMCEIYMYTFYGTELYYESITVTDAIYLGDWYNYDTKSKKALIILMERTKKPMLLMGGYVVAITIDTFTTILRRAYSLFAVVRNL